MFESLLVANRGEIAVRIMATARRLGIRTIAVYSDADAQAPHVALADQAVRLGPAPARESYLNLDALLDAAHTTGAQAIHPGYGFLSERAAFAHAVEAAGLALVGPTGNVIELMGRKDAAREVALQAGVPVVPQGLDGEQVRFPVLVKAAAGGGGKGMRIVHDPAELDAAMAAASREAAAAFGDDTLLVERYVERGRHVEVQILADHHGNVCHLFERDCSAQRRHQKVLEEAPAPDLSPSVRHLLHSSAVALARQVGYTNAGTVEYLVAGDEVFFLEMNTRLQVEHPVTEAITGLDLVEWQLRIAAGERLTFTQDDLGVHGHAMQARIYAEDAFGGFLPQAGRADLVDWPNQARVDHALVSGQTVTTDYDPMLAKIIVSGPDREQARRRLVNALDDTSVLGLTTNTGFVRALAASPEFTSGPVNTNWLDTEASLTPPDGHPAAARAAAALLGDSTPVRHPFGLADGWRLAGANAVPLVVLDGESYRVGAGHVLCPDGSSHPRPRPAPPHLRRGDVVGVAYQGHSFWFDLPSAVSRSATAGPADGVVLAPMPGTVLRVEVAQGDVVAEGDVLGVVEAMKMELALRAPYSGTITGVSATVGEQVTLKQPLFEIEPLTHDPS